MIVSLAFLYNFWVIIYRTAFDEITTSTILIWFLLDYLADFVYLMDILIHFRTGAASHSQIFFKEAGATVIIFRIKRNTNLIYFVYF